MFALCTTCPSSFAIILMGEERVGCPLKNQKKHIGFLSKTGPDPLKNHKTTKPAFKIGPLAFRWRAEDGPLILVFRSSLPS